MKQTSALPVSGVALTLETAPQIQRANSGSLTSSGKSILTKPAASWDASQGGDHKVVGGIASDSSKVLSVTPSPVDSAKDSKDSNKTPPAGEFVFSQPSSMPPRG